VISILINYVNQIWDLHALNTLNILY